MISQLFRNMPEVVKNLLIINILMFIGTMVFPEMGHKLALHYFESPFFEPYQIITHFFMHASLPHLFFNMFALVMFGSQLERMWGKKRFLIVYFVSAFGAFLLQMGFTWFELKDVSSLMMSKLQSEGAYVILNNEYYIDEGVQRLNLALNTGMIGASGAIMGLLAAFAYLFPNTELQLIFIPIPVKAKYMIPFFMFIDLTMGVANFQWDNIAHWAHLGGALFGLILVLIWKRDRSNFY